MHRVGSQARSALILAFDLGGTKLAVGTLTASGALRSQRRVAAAFALGKDAVIRQMLELGRAEMIAQGADRVGCVGVSSAGPLDPKRGWLLDPTNFKDARGRSWGPTPLTRLLRAGLKRPVALENDAACAALAEGACGVGRGVSKSNLMVLTLGTGLGTGILQHGRLLRTATGLHVEAGHIWLHADDRRAPCGCGNSGCAEAYLSGRAFEREHRASAAALAERARAGSARARRAFDAYGVRLGQACAVYATLFAPGIITLAGSFSRTAPLFLPHARSTLARLLARRVRSGETSVPRLLRSRLSDHACLIGAALSAREQLTRLV